MPVERKLERRMIILNRGGGFLGGQLHDSLFDGGESRCPDPIPLIFENALRVLSKRAIRGVRQRPYRALRHQSADEPAYLRGLCRNPARAELAERQCGHHGQSRRPQESQGRARGKQHAGMSSIFQDAFPKEGGTALATSNFSASARSSVVLTLKNGSPEIAGKFTRCVR